MLQRKAPYRLLLLRAVTVSRIHSEAHIFEGKERKVGLSARTGGVSVAEIAMRT